jgi:hypothetical protein
MRTGVVGIAPLPRRQRVFAYYKEPRKREASDGYCRTVAGNARVDPSAILGGTSVYVAREL